MNGSKSEDAGTDRSEDPDKSLLEGYDATSDGPIGVDAASAPSVPGNQPHHLFTTASSETSESSVTSGEKMSPDRWSRRTFGVATAGLVVAGMGVGTTWYFGVRSDKRAERNEVRENERYNNEFPVPVGAGIEISQALVAGVPSWPWVLVSSELMSPQDFTYGADREKTYRMVFNRGGGLLGRMFVDIAIKSRRHTVVINGAHVKVRSLGSPPNKTIFVPAPVGGGGAGEETEIPYAGVNLDSPQPVIRVFDRETFNTSWSGKDMLSAKNNPIILGGLFPEKQITLGPGDEKSIKIISEARTGYYEWELFFDIIADGEPQTIPVKVTNFPLRVAAPEKDYRAMLREAKYNLSGTRALGGVQAISMNELLGWI